MNFIFLIEFRFFFFFYYVMYRYSRWKLSKRCVQGYVNSRFSNTIGRIFKFVNSNCVEFWIWTFKHRVLILIFKVQYLDAIYKTADWNLKFLTIIPYIRNTRSGSKRKYVNSLDFKWNKDILCWYFIFR